MHRHRSLLAGLLLIASAASAVAGPQASQALARGLVTSHSHASARVNIGEANNKYLYAPKSISVMHGTAVIWTNKSDAPHTITATGRHKGMFDKQISAGARVQITFKKAGTYTYFCSIHPYMTAKVVVK